MQSIFPVKSLRVLLPIAGLLFLSVIYGSCNQPVASGKTSTSSKDSGVATVEDSKMTEGVKTAEVAVPVSAAVNSPEEAVSRFDDVKTRYMELVKIVKDSTEANSTVVPYVYIQQMQKVRQDADPVMQYFSHNRSKFSKAQIKHIFDGTDEMAKAMSAVPRPK